MPYLVNAIIAKSNFRQGSSRCSFGKIFFPRHNTSKLASHKIVIFSAARDGNDAVYKATAFALGQQLSSAGYTVGAVSRLLGTFIIDDDIEDD